MPPLPPMTVAVAVAVVAAPAFAEPPPVAAPPAAPLPVELAAIAPPLPPVALIVAVVRRRTRQRQIAIGGARRPAAPPPLPLPPLPPVDAVVAVVVPPLDPCKRQASKLRCPPRRLPRPFQLRHCRPMRFASSSRCQTCFRKHHPPALPLHQHRRPRYHFLRRHFRRSHWLWPSRCRSPKWHVIGVTLGTPPAPPTKPPPRPVPPLPPTTVAVRLPAVAAPAFAVPPPVAAPPAAPLPDAPVAIDPPPPPVALIVPGGRCRAGEHKIRVRRTRCAGRSSTSRIAAVSTGGRRGSRSCAAGGTRVVQSRRRIARRTAACSGRGSAIAAKEV